jgi:Zn-dependent M28 family amino/carboxypeptidase
VFHPSVVRHLSKLVQLPALSMVALTAQPLLEREGLGALSRRLGIAGLAVTLAALAEREIRGRDVAGASDNASGASIVVELASEYAERPLRHTQIDVLVTGCEESGLLGAQAYIRALRRPHKQTRVPVVFVNFDTVGGEAPLTYILGEGAGLPKRPSPRLVGLCEEIAGRRPELDLRAADRTPGLPTDATAAVAHGYEAITLLAQTELGIPNYHWPTDTSANIDARTLARTLEVGRELVRSLDDPDPSD